MISIIKSFNKYSSYYDQYSIIQKKIANRLLSYISNDISNSSILDLGCGTGHIFKGYINNNNNFYLQLDISENMINVASNKNKNSSAIVADIKDLPLKNNIIDHVISSMSLHWTDKLSLKEIYRVLNKNSFLYFSVPLKGSLKELYMLKNQDDFMFLKHDDILKYLLEAGYNLITYDIISYRMYYESVMEFLRFLKKTGSNSCYNEISYKEINNIITQYNLKFSEGEKVFSSWCIGFYKVQKI